MYPLSRVGARETDVRKRIPVQTGIDLVGQQQSVQSYVVGADWSFKIGKSPSQGGQKVYELTGNKGSGPRQ